MAIGKHKTFYTILYYNSLYYSCSDIIKNQKKNTKDIDELK